MNGGGAQHDGVAHDVVHLVGLENGLDERERHGRFDSRLDPGQQLHGNLAAAVGADRCAGHAREKFMPSTVEDGDRVSDGEPEHTREVLTLLARQGDGFVARVQRGRKEPVHARGRRRRRLAVMSAHAAPR